MKILGQNQGYEGVKRGKELNEDIQEKYRNNRKYRRKENVFPGRVKGSLEKFTRKMEGGKPED